VNLAFPVTSKLGMAEFPIPNLPLVLSQYKFAFEPNVVVPVQKATLVATPEPSTVLPVANLTHTGLAGVPEL
jgi:hypothetical protein